MTQNHSQAQLLECTVVKKKCGNKKFLFKSFLSTSSKLKRNVQTTIHIISRRFGLLIQCRLEMKQLLAGNSKPKDCVAYKGECSVKTLKSKHRAPGSFRF